MFISILVFNECDEKNYSPENSEKVNGKLVVNLKGEWKFSLGDSFKWQEKNFDDENWERITVPSSWENQGFHGYDGFAWYRKEFYLDKKFNQEKLIFLLGKVDDIDQTFINGVQIGSTGLWNFEKVPTEFNTRNEWEQKRVYTIPDGILNFNGENIIAVRVYDGFQDGGIYQGPVGIITQKKFKEFYAR